MSEVTGEVRWFDETKGYGFIKLPDGDVFVHKKELRRSGIDQTLVEGERVRFVIDSGPKGKFATNIVRADANLSAGQP